MKVLHITNDFAGSTVYCNLVKNLDNKGVSQIVYTPLRGEKGIGNNLIQFTNDTSEIIYSPILNYGLDRVFFKSKISKIYKDILKKVNFSEINIIHSHTWYSDGAVAFELYKRFKIPYIITIRNTDLNVFYNYMFHLRDYGRDILESASKIIFISNVYLERFKDTMFFNKYFKIFENKLDVISNGVDDFWLSSCKQKKIYQSEDSFRVLYIGKFDKDKNVTRLIKAVDKVNNFVRCELTLVGGGGDEESKILNLITKNKNIIYLGRIQCKRELEKVFSKHHLFAMPSKAETFGLVYIEAISQGLPIINTINEGIFGMYDKVGESVMYDSVDDISNAILKINKNYSTYDFSPYSIVQNHNWAKIADKYIEIYNLKWKV